MKNQVISLYDHTGEALRPWAEAGYECFAYDIQHKMYNRREVVGSGSITYSHADLYKDDTLLNIFTRHGASNVAFLSAFPPCTDLSAAGARHWKKKAEANPDFQIEAVRHLFECSLLARAFRCPFYIENPNGAVSRMWGIYQKTMLIRDIQRSFPHGMRTRSARACGRDAVSVCLRQGPWTTRMWL